MGIDNQTSVKPYPLFQHQYLLIMDNLYGNIRNIMDVFIIVCPSGFNMVCYLVAEVRAGYFNNPTAAVQVSVQHDDSIKV